MRVSAVLGLRKGPLGDRKQSRVRQRCSSVADPSQVRLARSECEEIVDAGLPDQRDQIPPLLTRSHEVVAAGSVEVERAASGVQERDRVTNVQVVGVAARDRARWSKFRRAGVVRHLAEPKQIEHHDRALNAPLEEPTTAQIGRLKVQARKVARRSGVPRVSADDGLAQFARAARP